MIEEAVRKILKELQTDVQEGMQKASKDTAKEGVADLKNKSPKRTGKYAQGWRQRKTGDSITIYDSSKPGLTHLLENGYTTRSGKRVKPHPHIKEIEQKIIANYVKRVEKALE